MRKKSYSDKRAFFAAMVIAGIMNWFYWQYSSVGSLPLHLCHTALFIMFIAFIFIIPALSSVMFLNGCIRTAVLTQESVLAKLLMAVFAFIPIVNIFFGFYCLKLISDSLKKEAAPY